MNNFSMTRSKKLVTFSIFFLLICGCLILFLYNILFPYQKKLPLTDHLPDNVAKNMEIVFHEDIGINNKFNYRLKIEDDKLYAVNDDTKSEIYTIDITNFEKPKLIGKDTIDDFIISYFIARGNYLYTDQYGSFEILDATNANNIKSIFDFEYPITSFAISEDYLYATGTNKNLYIFDITNPEKTNLVKEITNFDSSIMMFRDIGLEIYGDKLFFTDDNLYIYDITNPTEPKLITSYEKSHFPIQYLTISNKTAWTTGWQYDINFDKQFYVSVLDISDLYKPKFITTYDHYPRGMQGNIFLFYHTFSKPNDWNLYKSIHMMDMSNPRKPIELGYMSGDRISSLTNNSAMISRNNDIYIYTVDFVDGKLTVIKYSPEN